MPPIYCSDSLHVCTELLYLVTQPCGSWASGNSFIVHLNETRHSIETISHSTHYATMLCLVGFVLSLPLRPDCTTLHYLMTCLAKDVSIAVPTFSPPTLHPMLWLCMYVYCVHTFAVEYWISPEVTTIHSMLNRKPLAKMTSERFPMELTIR